VAAKGHLTRRIKDHGGRSFGQWQAGAGQQPVGQHGFRQRNRHCHRGRDAQRLHRLVGVKAEAAVILGQQRQGKACLFDGLPKCGGPAARKAAVLREKAPRAVGDQIRCHGSSLVIFHQVKYDFTKISTEPGQRNSRVKRGAT